MKQEEYNYNVAKAKDLATLSGLPRLQRFWDGYQQGLRNRYYGEEFGNVVGSETSETEISYKVLGYRLGYAKASVAEAYQATRLCFR